MAQDVSQHLFSYDEYAALDDGRRYQVIEGALVLTPSPRLAHQDVAAELWRLLADFARKTGLGRAIIAPFDVVLRAERPAVVVQPDVLFVSREGLGALTEQHLQGPPALAIEVVSPSNARLDMVTKRRLYAQYGVAEYWVVSLDADQILVHRRNEAGAYDTPSVYEPGVPLTSPLLPGFSLDVAALFAVVARGS